jgi:hypothetical protein
MSTPVTQEVPAVDDNRAGSTVRPRTLRGLMRYYLSLGCSGFGGPIALVGYMQRDLVEQRGWYTEDEFQQASRSRR